MIKSTKSFFIIENQWEWYSLFEKNKIYLIILFLSFLGLSCRNAPEESVYHLDMNKLEKKAGEAYMFCKENDFNTKFCLLADMSIHSGRYRFFVYDFQKRSVILQGLIAHGCGDSVWGDDLTKCNPKFSNALESHCTSLGKYRIGEQGYSNWGININYKLHGLEESNSNAYKRIIVLHSWIMVPEEEVFPQGTPEGWGCPAISNKNMKIVDSLLKKSNKPVLLWIYY